MTGHPISMTLLTPAIHPQLSILRPLHSRGTHRMVTRLHSFWGMTYLLPAMLAARTRRQGFHLLIWQPARSTGRTSATFLNPSQAVVGGGFVVFSGTTVGPDSTQLYVLDQNTGQLRYTVPVPEGNGGVIPTIVQNPTTGEVTAYVAAGPRVSAVSLQANSGSVAWLRLDHSADHRFRLSWAIR